MTNQIETTIEEVESHWSCPANEWGLLGPADYSADEPIRFVDIGGEYQMERQDEHGDWYCAMQDAVSPNDVAGLAGPMTTDDMLTIIGDHFDGYADADNAIAGFVAWAWDQRAETLKDLYSADLLHLAEEVRYSVQQTDDDQIRGLDEDELRDAAAEWLEEHTDEIIMEIGESYDDHLDYDGDIKYDDQVERLADIFDDCNIQGVGQYYTFADGQFEWVGRCEDLTGELLDEVEELREHEGPYNDHYEPRAYNYLCNSTDPVDDLVILSAVSAQVGHVIRPI